MWCSVCNREFEDVGSCPKCGAVLREPPKPSWSSSGVGDLLKRWPVGNDGEHIPPAYLTACAGTSYEAEGLISMLDAFGIPCIKQYPNNGRFGKLIIGVAGTGIELYVPETMLEDAKALLEGEPDYDDDDEI